MVMRDSRVEEKRELMGERLIASSRRASAAVPIAKPINTISKQTMIPRIRRSNGKTVMLSILYAIVQ